MRKRYLLLITFTLVLILSPGNVSITVGSLSSQEEIKVILDFDAAPADWAAMLYLLKHPAVTVMGIAVSCGVSYVDTGVINTLGILEHLDKDDIPVASGKETPLAGNHAFPTPWRDGSNNFYGLDLPTTSLQPSSLNASELIISLIQSSETNVTLVALGPLTNIAIALNAEPSIKSKIDEILLMGGAIDAPGNIGLESDIPNYVSEWNIWVDPYAANIVFQSGLLIRMVTLDATNKVPMTQAFLDRLEGVMTTPEAHLLNDMMTTQEPYLWDQLAVVTLTNPEVVTWERHCIEIILDLENHEGQTNSTNTGCTNADVAVSADAQLFEDLFIGYINDDLPTSTITTGTTTDFPSDLLLLFAIGSGLVLIVLVIILAWRRK
ncbi:MAG: nucleoside hydrolase [Candidatus Thorarchaeota archaeon]|nr:nucleoside hydrolase [Candidatus Thorarchaeota archaeon]